MDITTDIKALHSIILRAVEQDSPAFPPALLTGEARRELYVRLSLALPWNRATAGEDLLHLRQQSVLSSALSALERSAFEELLDMPLMNGGVHVR